MGAKMCQPLQPHLLVPRAANCMPGQLTSCTLPSRLDAQVLKAVVAQYQAEQLLTQRDQVSAAVRDSLTKRAQEFNILVSRRGWQLARQRTWQALRAAAAVPAAPQQFAKTLRHSSWLKRHAAAVPLFAAARWTMWPSRTCPLARSSLRQEALGCCVASLAPCTLGSIGLLCSRFRAPLAAPWLHTMAALSLGCAAASLCRSAPASHCLAVTSLWFWCPAQCRRRLRASRWRSRRRSARGLL